jgi:hypothetical protein
VRVLLVLLIAVACARAPIPAPERTPVVELETPDHVIGRFLCDACTGARTSEECIAHASFLMEKCRGGMSHCLRHTCRRLDDTDPDAFLPTGTK